MTKTQKISEINTYLNNEKVTKVLSEVKIGGLSLLSKRVNREDIKATFVVDVYNTLPRIETVLINYRETRALVPQKMWDYYKLMGFDNLETRALKDTIKQIKDTWRTLPKFRKADHVKQSRQQSPKATN